MNNQDKLLTEILGGEIDKSGAYNIRVNGISHARQNSDNITIKPKQDGTGIEITVADNTKNESLHIPVIISQSGLSDVVYNDFYIGKNCEVSIVAGCGIHNDGDKKSQHDGIHTFNIGENSKVKYFERHYAQGQKDVKKVLNPTTNIYGGKGSQFNIETIQISGVTNTNRKTYAKLDDDAKLIITEKLLTSYNQTANTLFEVELNGKNSSVHVVSRSVAEDNSYQEFKSNIIGNNKCFGHVECDAIIKANGRVKAVPEILANNPEANLIHEAAIGKIAGEQITKLMSLGLNEKDAEAAIITGFLK